MANFAKLICFMMILSGGLPAAAAGQDVTGWGKTTWGATHAEIAKLYQLQPWVADGAPRCDAVERVTINDLPFRVRFFFSDRSDTGRLQRVALIASGRVDHKSFIGLISSKYGPPDQQGRSYRGGTAVSWLKSAGRVEMVIESDIMAPSQEMITIDYIATSGDKGKI